MEVGLVVVLWKDWATGCVCVAAWGRVEPEGVWAGKKSGGGVGLGVAIEVPVRGFVRVGSARGRYQERREG